jgi:hypothetical protein
VYKKYPDAERVDFVVSRKQSVTHHLQEAHIEIKKWLGLSIPKLRELVGEIIPASMEDRLPLQCADLLCWHQQRYFGNTETAKDHDRLIKLGTNTDGVNHRWEPKELLAIAETMMPLPSKTAD